MIHRYQDFPMQYQKAIELLGYSPKEAKIYLALLKLGEAQVSDISHAVAMPRTTVQCIVERLYDDGIISFYIKRNHKYWTAKKPECFLDELHKKEETITNALPALTAIRNLSQRKVHKKNDNTLLAQINMCVSCALQPMSVSNEAGVLLFVNESWEQLFGYLEQEVRSASMSMLYTMEVQTDIAEQLWERLRRQRVFQSDNMMGIRKDKTRFSMNTTIFCLKYGNRIYYMHLINHVRDCK